LEKAIPACWQLPHGPLKDSPRRRMHGAVGGAPRGAAHGIAAHGCRMWFRPAEVGTTFLFTLPLGREQGACGRSTTRPNPVAVPTSSVEHAVARAGQCSSLASWNGSNFAIAVRLGCGPSRWIACRRQDFSYSTTRTRRQPPRPRRPGILPTWRRPGRLLRERPGRL
jgi:hypothetical protein